MNKEIRCFVLESILTISLIIIFSLCLPAQELFTDYEELEDAVNAAGDNGGTFIVKNGTYNDFEPSFEVRASETNPIIIQAETVGGVTLTGSSHFVFKKCAHILLEGFIIDGEGDDTLVKLEGCNNIRISRNVFELEAEDAVKWVYVGGFWNDYDFLFLSHNNRIDHNIFQNKNTAGHYITIDGTKNEDETILQQSQYDRIDHNYFKNNQPRISNEKESIRIGWSEMSQSSGFTIVEFNLFENCDGDPEIISVKSCDNTIRHNTFLKSYGSLVLRHGNRNRVEGNYFFGGGKANGSFESSTIYTGGIRIYGTDHLILNNYFEGLGGTRWDAPITLTQGDAIDGNSSSLSKHFRAERVTIAYNTLVDNTYGIEIGFDNNDNYNKNLEDIIIANNLVTSSTNSLVSFSEGQDQGDEITWINNIMFPKGDAQLTSDASVFSDDEVVISDPELIYDGSVWRASGASPVIISGVPELLIVEDIEGQVRSEESNAGADHFSMDSIRYHPMTPEDVGPYAYDDDEPVEILYVSIPSEFDEEGGTQTVYLISNLDWSITEEYDWISLTPESGSGNDTLVISVSKNPDLEKRFATISVEGGELLRTINISQSGANAPDGAISLVPIGVSASDFQDPNIPENTLDKDLDTRWSAESLGGLDGSGQTITYDLGDEFEINLVKIAFHKGDSRFTYFDISTSENGLDFTAVLTEMISSGTTIELENYLFEDLARYVRITGYGNSDSDWTSLTEVEIYGKSPVSVEESQTNQTSLLFPVPAKGVINLKNSYDYQLLCIYNVEGLKVLEYDLNPTGNTISVDVSKLDPGIYFTVLSIGNKSNQTQKILISP